MSDFKCLLVHTPRLYEKEDKPVSDITFCAMGLFSLAGEIKNAGFEVEILHLGIEKYLDKSFLLSDYVRENNVKFLAFSLQWHPQSYDVIETIRQIKLKNPDVHVSLGGMTASYFSKEILENFPYIDTIIKGEGEIPIKTLVQKLSSNEDLSDIPNLIWRKNGKIIQNEELFVARDKDLNNFDFFNEKLMKNYSSYSKIPFVLEYKKEEQLNNKMTAQGITLGRGCMGNCVYCGGGYLAVKKVTGRGFVSYRSPKSIISEIKNLQTLGIEVFRFVFDPNPKKRDYLLNLFKEIKKSFDIPITVEFQAYSIPDKEFLNSFKETFSEESKIAISADFYNEELRKKYRTFFFDNKTLEEILEYMDKLKIKSNLYFSIVPALDEVEFKKSKEYGRRLTEKFNYIQDYFIYPIEVEPASLWTFHPEKFGLEYSEKHFVDYYNDTKCYEKSFENKNIF